jgi:hypothetical protein
MPDITVHIFHGIKEQIPETFRVNGVIYQDIVTSIMNLGNQSGSIYGIHGETIDYNKPVTLAEVNYIIPDGGINQVPLTTENGRGYVIQYNVGGTFRDVYNAAIARGLPPNRGIVIAGKNMNLDMQVPTDLYQQNITYEPLDKIHVLVNDVMYEVSYLPLSATFRDIYNDLLNQGLPPNGILSAAGHTLDLSQLISSNIIGRFRDVKNRAHLVYTPPKGNIINPTNVNTGGQVTIQVQTPWDLVNVQIITGKTRANDIIKALSPKDSKMKLALVHNEAYNALIYHGNEYVYPPDHFDQLYLVPNYQTLFAAYMNQ